MTTPPEAKADRWSWMKRSWARRLLLLVLLSLSLAVLLSITFGNPIGTTTPMMWLTVKFGHLSRFSM